MKREREKIEIEEIYRYKREKIERYKKERRASDIK